ncbi:MAG: polysaccharide deacetylase family protein [Planctomycetia bacterium]|nr:polysaccharide deacetylase family protein [Planctomycetia bacterium]
MNHPTPSPDPPPASFTVDVEDWFHVLDSPSTPPLDRWAGLESRLEHNLTRLLDLLAETGTRATFFWLGWLAERHRALVRAAERAGHETASHGYAHVLAYAVGPKAFREDVTRAKLVLEDITGRKVCGFRTAGFSVTARTPWAFDVIREVGHEYDASLFPGNRIHGGVREAPLGPHVIPTASGPLVEFPISMVEWCGCRVCLFGGGYLRLSPRWLIAWGLRHLRAAGRPLIVYVHPREIDPEQPRLPLGPKRRFMYYVNLRTTQPKIGWLCRMVRFRTMGDLAGSLAPSLSCDWR